MVTPREGDVGGELRFRLSKVLTAHAAVMAGLSIAHSLQMRGLRGTLLFAALGHAVPTLGEHVAINVLKELCHRVEPQAQDVPLAITLGWYPISYATFAMV
jgi:hypothetical protein